MGVKDSRGAALAGVLAIAGRNGLGGNDGARAWLQLFKAAGGHLVARIDALDSGDAVIRRSSFYVLLRCNVRRAFLLLLTAICAALACAFLASTAGRRCAFAACRLARIASLRRGRR